MEYCFLEVETPKIEGESTIAGYEKQISIEKPVLALSNEVQMGGTFPGRTSGRPSAQDITIQKQVDKTTPVFAKACATGQPLESVKIHAVRQDEKVQKNLEYETVELGDVVVSSIHIDASGGIPQERLTLNYSKIKVVTKAQNTDGGVEGNKAVSYDQSTNAVS